MPRFAIVHFSGCPLMDRARTTLRDAGIASFTEINQDKLPAGHELKTLSSPSILMDDRLIAGNRNTPSTCSILNWAALGEELRKLAAKK